MKPWLLSPLQSLGARITAYIFKTATANRPLSLLPDGRVPWPYKDNATGKLLAVKLHPDELIRRFVQHLLPQGYCRVRCFGWLHPAAKARLNRIRALLKQTPLLSAREQAAWQCLRSFCPKILRLPPGHRRRQTVRIAGSQCHYSAFGLQVAQSPGPIKPAPHDGYFLRPS